MSFDDLGLSAALCRAVREQGYDTPTPIQAQAIPAIAGGGDASMGRRPARQTCAPHAKLH